MTNDLTQISYGDPASDAPAASMGSLLTSAWRRKSLILLGIVVGLIAGTAIYLKSPPVYQSSAQLMVNKKGGRMPPTDRSFGYGVLVDDYVSAHVTLIKSPLIVGKAVESGNLATLSCFAGKGDPTGTILENLRVARDTSDFNGAIGNVLNLSYQGSVPEDCPKVLEAVIKSYEDYLTETYSSANKFNVEKVIAKSDEVKIKINDLAAKYQEFIKSKPALLGGGKLGNYSEDAAAKIESERSALIIRRAKLEPRLKQIKDALKNDQDPAAIAAIVNEWQDDKTTTPNATPNATSPAVDPELTKDNLELAMQEKLFPLMMEEQLLLKDFGQAHPQVQSVTKRIEMTRAFFKEANERRMNAVEQINSKVKEPVVVQKKDPVKLYVAGLESELEDIKAQEAELTAIFAAESEAAKGLMEFDFQDSQKQNEILREEKFYESLMAQLQGIDLGIELGGFTTSTLSQPAYGYKVATEKSIFGGSLVLGFLAGFGLAFIAEKSDKSFRTPDEVRRRLGLPVVGFVPCLTPDPRAAELAVGGKASIDGKLCTHYRPKSVSAEAFRGIRTSLYFRVQNENQKVIQVTSADVGEGKSTLAANLAISIAQSGKRTLLVDADLRKPKVHKLFGLSSEVGLGGVIAGDVEVADAIVPTGAPNLDALLCGKIPANPAELLSSPRFVELLELLRTQYDFVIVDTPPLLVVSDPSIVASCVDGVLLSVRVARKDARPHAERAKEILAGLGARVMGVVVNGMDGAAGYGSYGGYGGYGGYGYGGYGGYGYGYGQEDESGYYASAKDGAESVKRSSQALIAHRAQGRQEN